MSSQVFIILLSQQKVADFEYEATQYENLTFKQNKNFLMINQSTFFVKPFFHFYSIEFIFYAIFKSIRSPLDE